jgi:hypothetical protein
LFAAQITNIGISLGNEIRHSTWGIMTNVKRTQLLTLGRGPSATSHVLTFLPHAEAIQLSLSLFLAFLRYHVASHPLPSGRKDAYSLLHCTEQHSELLLVIPLEAGDVWLVRPMI